MSEPCPKSALQSQLVYYYRQARQCQLAQGCVLLGSVLLNELDAILVNYVSTFRMLGKLLHHCDLLA